MYIFFKLEFITLFYDFPDIIQISIRIPLVVGV